MSKCDALLQEGLGGGSGELQAHRSELSAGEGYGADRLECHHVQDNQVTSQHGFTSDRKIL